MTRIAIFGATGSLGSHVARLAAAAGHDVSALVRTPSKLPADVAAKATITAGDLMQLQPGQLGDFIAGHDALVSCAGPRDRGPGLRRPVRSCRVGCRVLARGPQATVLAPGGCGAAGHRSVRAARCRPAEGARHLLAASRQLRTPSALHHRMAAALPGPDGGTASTGNRSAARVVRAFAGGHAQGRKTAARCAVLPLFGTKIRR